jgi:hypothetical protein
VGLPSGESINDEANVIVHWFSLEGCSRRLVNAAALTHKPNVLWWRALGHDAPRIDRSWAKERRVCAKHAAADRTGVHTDFDDKHDGLIQIAIHRNTRAIAHTLRAAAAVRAVDAANVRHTLRKLTGLVRTVA